MTPDQILYINAKEFLNKPDKFVDGDDHNLIHHMTEFAKTNDVKDYHNNKELIKHYIISFARWMKHTEFNIHGSSPKDCVNEWMDEEKIKF